MKILLRCTFAYLILISQPAFSGVLKTCLQKLLSLENSEHTQLSTTRIHFTTLSGQVSSVVLGRRIAQSTGDIYRSLDGHYIIKIRPLSGRASRKYNLSFHEFYATQYILENELTIQNYISVPFTMDVPGYGRSMIMIKEFIDGIPFYEMEDLRHSSFLTANDRRLYQEKIEELKNEIMPVYQSLFYGNQFLHWCEQRLHRDIFRSQWGNADINDRDFIYTSSGWMLLDP